MPSEAVEESAAIPTAQSKHPYPLPDSFPGHRRDGPPGSNFARSAWTGWKTSFWNYC
jgi:hypothetical protein